MMFGFLWFVAVRAKRVIEQEIVVEVDEADGLITRRHYAYALPSAVGYGATVAGRNNLSKNSCLPGAPSEPVK